MCGLLPRPKILLNLEAYAQQFNDFELCELMGPSANRPKPRQSLTLRKCVNWVGRKVLTNETGVANAHHNLKAGKGV